MFKLKLVFIAVVFTACHSKKTTNTVVSPASPVKSAAYFSQKPSRYYYDFDTTKGEMDNFDQGYVDTFSIAGIPFKLFANPDSTGNLEMQVFKDGKWVTNFKTFYANNGNDHSDDINEDGFPDFQQSLRNGSYVFFFNPRAKRFFDTSVNISFYNYLLDKKTKTFYEVWPDTADPEPESGLYQLRGLQKYYLFTTKCIVPGETDQAPAYLRLYKCRNGDPYDTVFIRQTNTGKDFTQLDFNYKKYWKRVLKSNAGE